VTSAFDATTIDNLRGENARLQRENQTLRDQIKRCGVLLKRSQDALDEMIAEVAFEPVEEAATDG